MRQCILTLALFVAAATHLFAQGNFTVTQLGTFPGGNAYGVESRHGLIWVAADTAGIYVHNPKSGGPVAWIPRGMNGRRCREVAVSPAGPATILVAVNRDQGTDDSAVVYRSTDGGTTWTPSSSGIVRDGAAAIVERIRFNDLDSSRAVLVLLGGPAYESTDGGVNWRKMTSLEGLTVNDMIWDSTRPGVMFAGGENFIFSPVLMKSTDWGASWRNVLDVTLGGDNAIDGIAINPMNPDLMIAGTEGYIVRSTDAGEHWAIVSQPGRYYLYGAAWGGDNFSTAFIAGGNHPPATGGFYMSSDQGITWVAGQQDEWRTIQRVAVSPDYPNAFLFTAGYLNYDEPPSPVQPGGIYIVRRASSSVPEEREYVEARYTRDAIYLANNASDHEAAWELRDLLGRKVAAGSVGRESTGRIALEGMPSGSYFFRYGKDLLSRVMKVHLVR